MVDLKAWVDVDEEELGINEKVYYPVLEKIDVYKRQINESAVSVTAAVNGRKPRVAGHWKRVINAGYAASVLNREVQDELEQDVYKRQSLQRFHRRSA